MEGTVISDRTSRSTINVLALGSFVRDLGQYIVWVLMSVYLNEARNVGYIDVGLIFLFGGLLSIPVSIYGGNLLDKFGRRKMAVLLPWLLLVLYSLLFVFISKNFATLLIEIIFVISGPVSSLQFVSLESIVSDVTAPQDRVDAFGLMRIAANVGIGVGLVGGGLLSEFSYSYVFLLPIAGSVIEGTLYFWKIPETSSRKTREKLQKTEKMHLLSAFADRLFISISLIISMAWFVTGMFESPLTPLYLTSIGNFTNIAVTVLFAVNTVVVITLQMPINRMMATLRDSTRIIVGILLYAMGYFIFFTTFNYLFLVLAVVILTIGENVGSPASTALVTKIAPEDRRGTFLGSYAAIGSLINPFRPMVATTILALTVNSPNNTWLILSAITLGIGFFLMVVFKSANRSIENRLSK